jgi:hypothetical protein
VIEPLTFSFEVDCSVQHAFEVWTAGFPAWWPADHTVTGRPDLTIVLEPQLGGRIFERTPDGVEHEWGEVTRWEPPNRLGYLWHLRRDRTDATDVQITFREVAAHRATVEIVHQGWERLGADGPTWRTRNTQGWQTLLPHYQRALEQTHH